LNAAQNKGSQKVAVLGSGWLLDIPVAELLEMFGQVWLFDIKHPVQVKKKFERYPEVKLVEVDISGFALEIYKLSRKIKSKKSEIAIDTIKPNFDFELSDFDLVVSCNLLNQLDIILIDYLRKTCKVTSQVEIQLRKLIQDIHIQLLPIKRSCLISDIEELSIDKHGCIIHRKPLIYTDKLSTELKSEWTWFFDNHLTYKSHCNTWFNVVAVDI